MILDPLLTPAQVAQRLNVKKRTVLQMLAEGGRLHHLRVDVGPKVVRVDPEALQEFIDKGAKQ